MSSPNSVPLTAELFESYYKQPSPSIVRGHALMLEDRVIAVGGLFLIGSCWLAFCDLSPEARAYRKSIYAVALQVRELMEKCKLPVVADRDEGEPNSAAFLTRLGFTEQDGVWVWEH